jgi:hypothetical protein
MICVPRAIRGGVLIGFRRAYVYSTGLEPSFRPRCFDPTSAVMIAE